MELTFVTGNADKMREARAILGDLAQVLQDTGGYVEIQADTLEAVAEHGLHVVMKRLDPPYFLEDAGLFIDALGGFPGVYSAYVLKTLGWRGLLRLMENVPDDGRTAHFSAVVGYRDERGVDRFFRGDIVGTIAREGRGDQGFGFDPVFVPRGHDRTFAEMTLEEKSALSHRGVAMRMLRDHLLGPPPANKEEEEEAEEEEDRAGDEGEEPEAEEEEASPMLEDEEENDPHLHAFAEDQ